VLKEALVFPNKKKEFVARPQLTIEKQEKVN
jgi:hypothetical protein